MSSLRLMSLLIDISNFLIVLLACGLSLIVPTLIVACRICENKSWPNILLVAFVLGLSTQGILGFICNHYLRIGITFETTIYFLGWFIISILVLLSQKRRSLTRGFSLTGEDLFLIGLLILAVAVRSIHPLQHMALGQSDAYSHLHFLRDVVDRGFVHNVIYPPGYHWILALPTAVFHLDPYLVARYGGALFGAGLVLAVYVLMRYISGGPAALISAFLVACFPGLYLLLKTGVGVFANQLGLLLIPVTFIFYVVTEEKTLGKSTMTYVLLALSLMGLSVSVPMMLIHVLMILGMIRMTLFFKGHDKWWFRTGMLALAILPAITLLGLHLFQAGTVHQEKTIEAVTAGAYTVSVPSLPERASKEVDSLGSKDRTGNLMAAGKHPVISLIRDFFTVKRLGIGNIGANALGYSLMIVFAIIIVPGVGRGNTGFIALGLWGFIASLQTLTGFLQFSGYQREGWSLMIAFACLAGMIGWSLYCWGKRWILFKAAAVVAVVFSIVGSFLYPPAHELRASCAEDEIIKIVRDISFRYSNENYWSFADQSVGITPSDLSALPSQRPLTIITRKIAGWHDYNQGELVPAVIHPSDRIRVSTVFPGENLADIFLKNEQYLILMDEQTEGCGQGNILFSMIDPRQVQGFSDGRQSRYKINDAIRSYLDILDRSHWQIVRIPMGQNLVAFAVLPIGAASSADLLRGAVP
jgi:membrane protein YdbS with pleckstrin-like domain